MHIMHKVLEQSEVDTLVTKLSLLRYDSLRDFIVALAEKLRNDALIDKMNGRTQVASSLAQTADKLIGASVTLDKTWEICKKYENVVS